MGGDRQQPRRRPRRLCAIEAGQGAQGLEEGLLGGVFGGAVVAEQARAQREDAALVAGNKGPRRFAVAGAGAVEAVDLELARRRRR